MFESDYEKRQRKEARLRELVEGKTFIVLDNDSARYDITRDLKTLGASNAIPVVDAVEAKQVLESFSRDNKRVDMIITDIQVDLGHEGGSYLIEFLKKFDFQKQQYRSTGSVFVTDEQDQQIPYGRELPILIHSGGAECRQYVDNKTVFLAVRGQENLLEAIGRTLEKLEAAKPKPVEKAAASVEPTGEQEPATSTFDAQPPTISQQEYYKMVHMPVSSKSGLFHAARQREQDRVNKKHHRIGDPDEDDYRGR